ncbi:MAG TPA: hypothetical protein VD970_08250 [Acetobacteraceae bacterium]|nr:hypothetical protein [Acetobacteraceae bacterium]
MRLHHLALAASLVALAACADNTRPAPTPVAATPPPAAAPPPATGFDGRYAGTLTRTAGSQAACGPRSSRATMAVANGNATLAYGPRGGRSASGAAQADGSIALSGEGGVQGAGRVQRNRFTGQLRSGDCAYNVALTRAATAARR